MDPQDHQVHLVRPVIKAHLGLPVRQDLLEILDHKEIKVLLDKLVRPVMQDRKALKDHLVQQVMLVNLGLKVLWVQLEQLDQRDHRVLLDLSVPVVTKVPQVSLDREANLEVQDQQVIQDLRAQQETPDS